MVEEEEVPVMRKLPFDFIQIFNAHACGHRSTAKGSTVPLGVILHKFNE